jgi:16S rRNA (guanine1207-N2)-methyltransferase
MGSPAARVWAVDVNHRALDLLHRTAESLGLTNLHTRTPDDVPADLRFATMWSNPPIRVGKTVLHEMLRTWLGRLTPDGAAYLVVQRNLGADSLRAWIDAELSGETGVRARKLASAKGFRVLRIGPDQD